MSVRYHLIALTSFQSALFSFGSDAVPIIPVSLAFRCFPASTMHPTDAKALVAPWRLNDKIGKRWAAWLHFIGCENRQGRSGHAEGALVSRQGIAFDYNLAAELYLSRPSRRHTD
jgi:hypothetical protein